MCVWWLKETDLSFLFMLMQLGWVHVHRTHIERAAKESNSICYDFFLSLFYLFISEIRIIFFHFISFDKHFGIDFLFVFFFLTHLSFSLFSSRFAEGSPSMCILSRRIIVIYKQIKKKAMFVSWDKHWLLLIYLEVWVFWTFGCMIVTLITFGFMGKYGVHFYKLTV